MLPFIYLLIIIAVALIIIGISSFSQESAIRIELPAQEVRQVERTKAPAYLSYIFPFSQKLLAKFKLDVKIKNRLDAAHVKLSPQGFFNFKLILMLLLGISSIFVLKQISPMMALGAFILGFILPDLWLIRKIKQRKYAIVRLLPETVDLLGLCVEGGLDFATAGKWVIEKTFPNPMTEELAFVLEEIKWGKRRAQALKDMATRLNIPEVTSFVQTLIQAERMGTTVAEAFTIISEDARLRRFHRGERFAMQAPIKILIPLIFCIFPAIAIMVGGPIFLQFIQGGMFKGLGY